MFTATTKDKKKILLKINELCFLRIITIHDVSNDYINWMNDNDVVKFTQQKNILHSKKRVSEFVNEKLKSKSDFLFGIFYKQKHIGNTKLGPILWSKDSAEISFIIGKKELWGNGIGFDTVNRVIKFAFNELNLNEINATFYKSNIASGKIFKKCGFSVVDQKNDLIIVNYKKV